MPLHGVEFSAADVAEASQWIFSFVGLPVVVVSLMAIFVSAVGVPRRLAAAVGALAVVGFGVGLVVLRLTEPPGEHIFG